MKVFALGDLHLAGNDDKPMDVFDAVWYNHQSRIERNWRETVSEGDLVLIPGDISWAMHLSDALDDIAYIASLPGEKLIMRGNHDYWWSSLQKVRNALPKGIHALQNDSFTYGEVTVCGSRGWSSPQSSVFSESQDRAVYERELIRLSISLGKAAGDKFLIGMLHYPPLTEKHQPTGFSELFENAGARCVAYGHLHYKACAAAFEGMHNQTEYFLCSADHIGFKPRLIAQV